MTAQAAAADKSSRALPAIRPDLALVSAAPSSDREERWLIHDPLQQRYIQLEPAAYHLLQLWPRCRTVSEVRVAMWVAHRVEVTEAEVAEFGKFLADNHLVADGGPDAWRGLHAKGTARTSILLQALHNYLFFRIPLVKPDTFLRVTLPAVEFLFSRTVHIAVAGIGVAGLYLVSRQWETFSHTFQHFFTPEGALFFGVVLILVKIAHELGHAYAAARYGCHVPTMGVALILMAPLPYTDVTDAWKLTDRRKRLVIDSAGMLVELGIAALATFLWAFLPNGPARGVAFMLATVGWILSLGVNLNPLMRFDGYYLLSEIWGVENLQQRSFVLGRWRLRELLFGLGMPCPEQMPPRKVRLLVAYAWAVWVYRLLLFVGIALVVYHLFFKLLGILLFAVEIAFFVAMPIWDELKLWWSMRHQLLRQRRTWMTTGATASIALLAMVPWSHTVRVPALLEVSQTAQVFPPSPALVTEIDVRQGDRVAPGATLVRMTSPDLERQVEIAQTQMGLTEARLGRRVGDEIDREATLVLQNEQAALRAKIAGLKLEQERLTVKAPIGGRVLELNPLLHPGRWVSPKEMIGLIGDLTHATARGYVSEGDLWRIDRATRGTFVPDMPTRPSAQVVVKDISLGGVASIDLKELSSVFGGRVAASPDRQDRHVPASGQYLVQFEDLDAAAVPDRTVRGTVLLQGKAQSWLTAAWRQVVGVLIRESGM